MLFVIPILAAVVAVRGWVRVVPRPPDAAGSAIWLLCATALAVVTVGSVGWLAMRLVPLVAWLRLSLIFPGPPPSRARLTLREGSARDLQRRIMVGESLGENAQEAAQNLLLLMRRLNVHDRSTRGHGERVRAYSDLIAEEMDLPAPDRAKLHWAALAHDVGKLHLPRSLLVETGHSTQREWELVHKHPALAAHLMNPLRAWLGEWVEAATRHHERYDGGGYPDGLKGDEIHISARIVAVADAFDNMTSTHHHPRALSLTDARAELAASSGTRFDPDVVHAFGRVSDRRLRMAAGRLAGRAGLAAGIGFTAMVTSTDRAMAVGASSVAGAAIVVTSALGASASVPAEQAEVSDVAVERLASDGETSAPIEGSSPSVGTGTGADPSETPGESRAQAPSSTVGASSVPSSGSSTTSSTTSAPGSTSVPSGATEGAPPPPTTTTAESTGPTTTFPTGSTTTTDPTGSTTTTVPTGSTTTAATTSTTTSTTTTIVTTTLPPTASWANDDTYSGDRNVLHVLRVLENDSPPAGFDYESLTVVDAPANGTASVVIPTGNPSQARITYRSDPGFVGIDTFTYEICDLAGDCATAEVWFTSL